MIVSCENCGVKLKVDETRIKVTGSKLKCPKCANIFTVFPPQAAQPEPVQTPRPPKPPVAPPQTPQPVSPPPQPQAPASRPEERKPAREKWQLDNKKIVVAHDGDAVLKLIEDILSEAGYEAVCTKEGVETVIAIEREKPFLVILDVALPRIYGFEICDRLKNSEESKDIKIILLASIYDKTRYKREPESLYGADDYIEKHHIQDCLVQKVQRLLTQRTVPGQKVTREEEFCKHPAEMEPVHREKCEQMRRDEFEAFQPAPAQAPPPAPSALAVSVDPQLIEAARRFSRIILSDIALYNQSEVEAGIKNGDLRERLAEQLREGRDLYNTRVSEEVRAAADFFNEELVKFIEKKKNTMQMGG